MQRDYYYFKEILLSVREEYLKLYQELETFKQYITCNDKRIQDFYFWLFQISEMKEPQIYIESISKNQELLESIFKLFHYYAPKYNITQIQRNEITNQINIINNRYNFKLNKNFITEINNKIDKILQTNFVKNIPLNLEIEDPLYKFINLSLSDLEFATSKYYLNYLPIPNQESILFQNHFIKDQITASDIFNLLDTKILKSSLPPYHQKLIEQNKNFKELHLLNDNFGQKETILEIEDKNGIVLCKKKRNITNKQ